VEIYFSIVQRCVIRLKADTGSDRKRTPFRPIPDAPPAESGQRSG
jgi:hypothetical protein